MKNLDFDPTNFVQEYDERCLVGLISTLSEVEVDGRKANYVFEPNKYDLELFVTRNGYKLIGSTNYNKVLQEVPLSLKHLEIPTNSKILIVGGEYNADYYVSPQI